MTLWDSSGILAIRTPSQSWNLWTIIPPLRKLPKSKHFAFNDGVIEAVKRCTSAQEEEEKKRHRIYCVKGGPYRIVDIFWVFITSVIGWGYINILLLKAFEAETGLHLRIQIATWTAVAGLKTEESTTTQLGGLHCSFCPLTWI